MDGENDLMEEKHHIRVAMESKELQYISVDVDPIEHELDEDKLDETDLDDDGMGKQDDLDVAENDATSVVVSPPFEGQVFCTKDAAHTYYVQYAKQTSFSVRKRGDVKVEGIVRYTYFVYHRAERGSKKDALTPSERSKPVTSNVTGCMARMRLILREVGDYKVSQLILDHNHDVSPNKARLMAQHRYISRHDKMRLSYNDQGGIRRNLNFSAVAAEHGGYEQTTFTQKDANNFIDLDRKLRLGEGDAPALCKHFMEMHKRNSDFFYVIDFDRENRIRNVFWADARSRAAYESFGDVVSFDTTYLTNKCEMPFAPFVGVNHHGQSILLGCTLLCKEDEENFSWLFETWKECMGGVAPPCIITDQCGAMRLSIAKVFPNAKHRWCLWHIMKKIPKYFGQYSNYNSIKKRMQHVVYDSLREVDFDTEWKLMVEEYFPKGQKCPKGQKWLKDLFTNRGRWVPAYLRGFFWAGMSTTQRSESMNAFFDGYVNSSTSLRSFVQQYGVAMLAKVEKENVADHVSFQTEILTFSSYLIEKQFQRVYTKSKFKQFQDELRATINCGIEPLGTIGNVSAFEVLEDVFHKDRFVCKRKPEVRINRETNEVSCQCRLLEFKGIMCRHSLVVYRQCSVSVAPSKYVLPRWFKGVKRSYNFIKCCYQESRGRSKEYHLMCEEFSVLASNAESDQANISMVRKAIRMAQSHIDGEGEVNVSLENVIKPSNAPTIKLEEDIIVEEPESVPLNPSVVTRKGRPRSKRLVGADEVAIKKSSKKRAKKDDTQVTPVYHGYGMEPMRPYANALSGNSNMVYVGDRSHGFGMKDTNPHFIVDPNEGMMGSGPQYYPVPATLSPRFSQMRPMVYNAASSSGGGGSMGFTFEPCQQLHPTYSPRSSALRPLESITSSSSGGGATSYSSKSFQHDLFPTQGTQGCRGSESFAFRLPSGGGSMGYTFEQRQQLHPTYSPIFSPLRPMESITSSSSGGGSMSFPSELFQHNLFPTQGTQDSVSNQDAGGVGGWGSESFAFGLQLGRNHPH